MLFLKKNIFRNKINFINFKSFNFGRIKKAGLTEEAEPQKLEDQNEPEIDQTKQNQAIGEYVIKSRIGGHSQDRLYEKYMNFHNQAIDNVEIPGTTIVRSKQQAQYCVKILKTLKDRVHAWDTETIDIDLKVESAVGNGRIICASAYCGLDVDFGNGPRLFIDNFAQNAGLINIFKEYLEDEKFKKVWHNYGFDRHMFYNHGINVKGFGGDTMHMTRLLDPSRGPKEYSLASISKFYEEDIVDKKRRILENTKTFCQKQSENIQQLIQIIENGEQDIQKKDLILYKLQNKPKEKMIQILKDQQEKINKKLQSAIYFQQNSLNINIKTNMKQLFGKKKYLKDGKEGKTLEFPTVIRMHSDIELINNWINYSSLDAEVTFFLYQVLMHKLQELQTNFENMKNMKDLYEKYWLIFGELLTDMERKGYEINVKHLEEIEKKANEDIIKYEKQFLEWVTFIQPGLEEFNPSSVQQLQHLFFAPFKRNKQSTTKKKEQNDLHTPQEQNDLRVLSMYEEEQEEDEGYYSDGRKKANRKIVDEVPKKKTFKVPNTKQIILEGKKAPLKHFDMEIEGLGLEPISYTETGMPAADLPVLKILAGNPDKGDFGKIGEYYKKNGQLDLAEKASKSIQSLIQLKSTETLLQTFIIPLRLSADQNSRIHCSLNINTETGRISARKPNLLNQPALDKDVYKIRSAFQASKGNKLIVADYGQLELRILAHMTNCKAMLEAFHKGGDFHSRTALSMYPNIQKEINEGSLLLEWDKNKGQAPAPLLKDKYSSERKKAKMMNFSIAYGKSAHGFAKDWGCTFKEAEETLKKWFQERQEVKQWQDKTKQTALEKGFSQTLMGRYRNLTKLINKKSPDSIVSHGLRAAINTPIQGGAADLVIAAMVKISQNQQLKKLGFELVLQIHDELILEGPAENAEEALKLVIRIMENPLDVPLLLKMEVDAKIGDNWYQCK